MRTFDEEGYCVIVIDSIQTETAESNEKKKTTSFIIIVSLPIVSEPHNVIWYAIYIYSVVGSICEISICVSEKGKSTKKKKK